MELGRWSIYQAEELEFGISNMEFGRWSISQAAVAGPLKLYPVLNRLGSNDKFGKKLLQNSNWSEFLAKVGYRWKIRRHFSALHAMSRLKRQGVKGVYSLEPFCRTPLQDL
jgi:hypothetical protein